ncbi:MBL fold metallo-hydrolase [Streptoalloteichus hindustanus]|uniref:Metallo-beta-lactamase superfamily protein n=1 Tax=Streptoalloteichus hindustanus TaxID=2017 RepID=A0A1M5ETD7_STRHI|nr:MBL fold metallo-hydrolase [Streptoalloteichus hindustanus]SHF82396.1 Metallo-beta-lactamase superfamily protein [Streptoalloteichus hindustanus]
MPVWICATCVNHYPESDTPPASCVICDDERQWVPSTGQRWTTLAELGAAGHTLEVREIEPGLVGLGVEPGLGINQRGLLVRTPKGNLLWDPPGFLDEAAVRAVRELGGLHAVSSSHPHMYGAAVEWSRAFDVPVLLAEDDLSWVTRPDPAIRPWSGSLSVLPGVTLVQCGGHFPGSSVLHWADGADGAGALLTGDTIYVTPGQDRVTFLWSAPNMLPLPERLVRQVVSAVRPYEFDRVYGGWWTSVLDRDAKRVVERCADRYVQFLRGDAPER